MILSFFGADPETEKKMTENDQLESDTDDAPEGSSKSDL